MPETWKELVGQAVNKQFQLREFLGETDHSAVFLTGRPGGTAEKAAIKLIEADPQNADSQLSRWSVARKLSHPHLIRLFETGRCEINKTQYLYVVMEYAEENLSQILPQRPLTPAETREMLQPVLSALAYIHRQGFVHSRLAPSNVMATGDELKTSADGLCAIGDHRQAAKANMYAPPELATQGWSPAGDIWCLGVLLVEVMTQRPPVWNGQGDATPPQSMPAPFLKIARECLRREANQRCTIADILGMLQPSPAVSARPTPDIAVFANQDPPSSRRYVVPAIAAGVVIVALVGGPKLFRHSSEPASTTTAEQTQPAAVAKQAPRPAVRETRAPSAVKQSAVIRESQPTEPAGEEAARPSSVAPLRASYPSETKPRLAGEFVPGDVLEKVLPHVPQQARDTIHGTVRVAVRVHVDASGHVAGAKFDFFGPSKYFARLAMDAARRWRFDPPSVGGQDVASDWVLRFEFTQAATRVIPVSHPPA